MALEELEKELYQQSLKNKPEKKIITKEEKESIAEPLGPAVQKEWAGKETKEKIQSTIISKLSRYGRILFWLSIVIFLIIGGAAGFYIYKYFTAQDIELALGAPTEVLSGAPFDLTINFDNNSNNILQDAKLSIDLPDNAALTGNNLEKRIIIKDLGDLGIGTSLQEKFSIIVLSDEQTVKHFNASLSYSLKSTLGTRFEKNNNIKVNVREPGIKLDLIVPQKVLNNEDFEIEVRYQNISEIDFSGMELEMVYPSNFFYKKSSITPAVGNRIWNLENLAKGSEGGFTIKGSVAGPEMSFFEIKSVLSASFLGQKYLISKKSANLNIASSPLSLAIQINDKTNYLASPDESLKYRVDYRNNTDVGLSDVIVKAQLVGEMFDFTTLNTPAFFSSLDNTLTWNAANSPALRLLEVGASGFLEFQINAKSNYPIKRLSDKNFVLKVQAEINSPTVPYYVAAERTVGMANFETKVIGRIEVDSRAFLKEPVGSGSGISNKGVWPPKVNQPTNYTIHWVVTNYATDVRDIKLKAFLQSGVRWTGEIRSNIESKPVYNERTQEVVWTIAQIPANKGVIGKPVEAIFQIEATPNITQVNNYMPLMTQTSIKAFDEFANVELNNSDEPLTTNLVDDPTVDPREGAVVQ